MTIALPPQGAIDDAIRRALAEDLGDAGDLTSVAIIPADRQARAVVAARKPGVLAGVPIATQVFHAIDPTVRVTQRAADGDSVPADAIVLDLVGSARAITIAERVALNFLCHLSGIATSTAEIARSIAHTKARVCCTRKTTPGLRALEKYAVRCGGGLNHRYGLYDAILIKDNHIAAAGGVAAAIRAARTNVGHMVKIEVEVDTLEQLDIALMEKPDVILLDNMGPDVLREAVKRVNGRAATEASGSITKVTAPALAEAGVDLLSAGWITHSSPCLDLGLDFI